MRVLIVDDDEEMAQVVAVGLRRARMAVDVAFDGTEALERLGADGDAYDVVVLDRDLPGTHGDEVCAALIAAGC
ncbi:response regulator, partial [Streptomyces sp. MCAF7]